jgi:hypothetical protein
MKVVFEGTHETFSQYMDNGTNQLVFERGVPQDVSDAHAAELLKRSDFRPAADGEATPPAETKQPEPSTETETEVDRESGEETAAESDTPTRRGRR